MRDVTMDDYLPVVRAPPWTSSREITGRREGRSRRAVHRGRHDGDDRRLLGPGGTERGRNCTLLNTLLDYRDPGALGVFTDERSVARLEKQMARTGFLDGEKMAGTFDALRPNDLIFNYVVSNWLMGEAPPAFDILSWNADSTRMPARMHGFYLRSLYVKNQLARGELELAGVSCSSAM